jgi:shikimate dehydrogenase
MEWSINKDTQVCISLAARPGNFGTYFHNYLYREHGLNFVYKAFSTRDLPGAIRGIRALGIRGSAVSMPFKEACIEHLDELDPSAKSIMSVNTIVNTDGHLKAYNTDYIAIMALLRSRNVPTNLSFALRGSGGMAKAVACALRDAGFSQGSIVARNEGTGIALAGQYGFAWKADLGADKPGLLINVTHGESRRLRFRRCGAPGRNAAHSTGPLARQTHDLRRGRDRAASRRAICTLHRDPALAGRGGKSG